MVLWTTEGLEIQRGVPRVNISSSTSTIEKARSLIQGVRQLSSESTITSALAIIEQWPGLLGVWKLSPGLLYEFLFSSLVYSLPEHLAPHEDGPEQEKLTSMAG